MRKKMKRSVVREIKIEGGRLLLQGPLGQHVELGLFKAYDPRTGRAQFYLTSSEILIAHSRYKSTQISYDEKCDITVVIFDAFPSEFRGYSLTGIAVPVEVEGMGKAWRLHI